MSDDPNVVTPTLTPTPVAESVSPLTTTQTMTQGVQGDPTKSGLPASSLDSPAQSGTLPASLPGVHNDSSTVPAGTPVIEQPTTGWKKFFTWIPGIK